MIVAMMIPPIRAILSDPIIDDTRSRPRSPVGLVFQSSAPRRGSTAPSPPPRMSQACKTVGTLTGT